MHELLRQVLNKTVDVFQNDERCLAAFHAGSVATADEDEFSDVDPGFIIHAEDFKQVDRELPTIFGSICQKIHLWWPERCNCDTYKNYAVLFEMDSVLLQYDVTIMTPPTTPIPLLSEQFIFDKANLLRVVAEPEPIHYSPERLRWTAEIFWVYAYITAKYLRRKDLFKLLYAQQELRDAHLEILRALNPIVENFWWPLTIKKVVPKEKVEDIALYFGNADVESIAKALPKELSTFSRDAKAACVKWGVEYPEGLDRRVREHLQTAL